MAKKKTKKQKKEESKFKRERELNEIKQLEELIALNAPARGTNPLANEMNEKTDENKEKDDNNTTGPEVKKDFAELPISKATVAGLESANYKKMTAIQRASLPHALCGRDVLAAAKTGSGKTLAYIIPILEKLYRIRWSSSDGLASIVISPTRELALQIFEVLRKVGSKHGFSAGLVIGGKDSKEEETRISQMNILICTPGRLLHHLDRTVGFDASTLQVLVLDEADRILDMGFEKSLNSIIKQLPIARQTLLFSATQTKSIRSLARLSLKDPEYISVHEQSKYSTPQKLQQFVLVCTLDQKMDILWSFIRSHVDSKMIVFFSSCKQVKYAYETFRQMRPGCTVLGLHGKIKQMKRMGIYVSFCEKEGGVVLFATDLAARGLDFPAIDWVIQADCPEDTDTYIHRVGRTARYRAAGKALLILIPSEIKMVDMLEEKKVPLSPIKVNPKKTVSIQNQLTGLISKDQDLKYLAQKSFVSYMRSVYLNANKEIFKIDELPSAEYATSLGLLGEPRIRFTRKMKVDKNTSSELQEIQQSLHDKAMKKENEKMKKKKKKEEENDSENENEESSEESDGEIEDDEEGKKKKEKSRSKLVRMRNRLNQDVYAEHRTKLIEKNEEDSDEDDFLSIKRKDHALDGDNDENDKGEGKKNVEEKEEKKRIVLSKTKKKKLLSRIVQVPGSDGPKRTLFDDEGEEVNKMKAALSKLPEQQEITSEEYIAKLRQSMRDADTEDRLIKKQLRKEKKHKQKEQPVQEGGFQIAQIGGDFDDNSDNENEYEDDNEDDDQQNYNDDDDDDDEEEEEEEFVQKAASKKRTRNVKEKESSSKRKVQKLSMEDQEELALRILESKT